MKIGASVNSGWQVAYTPDQLLTRMREAGLDYFEIVYSGDRFCNDLLNKCAKQKIPVHFHSSGHANFNLANWTANKKTHDGQIQQAMRMARFLKEPVTIVYHGACGTADREMLLNRTAEFFAWFIETYPRELVVPVIELMTPLPEGFDIGSRLEELMAITDRVPIQICWDMGHSTINPDIPQEELVKPDFTQRVGYVHLHDIGENDADHNPFYFHRTPWEKYLTALLDAGYDGCITLEYGFNLIKDEAFDRLEEDSLMVKEFIKNKQGGK